MGNLVTQAVIVESTEINPGQGLMQIAFYHEDGTAFDFGDSGNSSSNELHGIDEDGVTIDSSDGAISIMHLVTGSSIIFDGGLVISGPSGSSGIQFIPDGMMLGGVKIISPVSASSQIAIPSGNTASRPSPSLNEWASVLYFDTTLGKPIWYDPSNNEWVDATGTAV